jgi:hypothetical protein
VAVDECEGSRDGWSTCFTKIPEVLTVSAAKKFRAEQFRTA